MQTPKALPKPGTAQTDSPLFYNGYEIQDPKARLALFDVGDDPAATEYWMEAINDPDLPSAERKDLIEDLNQTGLMDRRHASTPQDHQLVLNRIALIEAVAPYAMDRVNAAAFAEAYKDLIGLAHGQTPP